MANDSNQPSRHSVTFHAYPKLLFTWPLLLAGPALWGLGRLGIGDELLGWIYMFILLVVLLTVSVDIERNHGFVWLVIFGLFFFLGRWLTDAYDIPVFSTVYDWLGSLHATYAPGFGLALSILLAIPYAVMMLWVRIQNKWRITHNEFEHYSWGRADDSLARGAKRVRTTYPDLLELLLCGAGTLIVYSATGRSELRRIHNVPFLPLLRRRIDRILEYTAVTDTDMLADEEVEAEREEDLGGNAGPGDAADHEEL
ncbi:MAG: hypothetical protein GVY24_06285 [Planctomycetes bacterium]|jgi:hypothetical protein|nr:hypothetical protein [Planctomycetota bacterium]